MTQREEIKLNTTVLCIRERKKKGRDPLARGGLCVLVSSLASSLKVRGTAYISRLLADIVFVW